MRELKQFENTTASGVSANGDFLATLSNGSLNVLRLDDFANVRTISMSIEKGSIKWSKARPRGLARRLLLYTADDVWVWDMDDPEWTVHITNRLKDNGRIVQVEFGNSNDEVITTSDFTSKLTIWSLSTGRSVEIRDPKPGAETYAYHPSNGFLAVLSRPAAQDFLTLHLNNSYEVYRTVSLRTIDAKGLKWSPDGQWLAVWDSASGGCRVELFTADVTSFRMLGIDEDERHADRSTTAMLGVASIVWSPMSNVLAVAGLQQDVQIYGTRTFRSLLTLRHPSQIDDHEFRGSIWQEVFHADANKHTYQKAQMPVIVHSASSMQQDLSKTPRTPLTCFNREGSLLACTINATTSAVWIWDAKTGHCIAIIIHFSPLRQLLWHPGRSDVMLTISGNEQRTGICLWQHGFQQPLALDVEFRRGSGRLDVQWICTRKSMFLLRISNNTMSRVLDLAAHIYKDSHGRVDDSPDFLHEALSN